LSALPYFLLVFRGSDNSSRDRLDQNEAIADALDPMHILGDDTERLTLLFVGVCPSSSTIPSVTTW
jgi:hypothetical protein